MDEFILIFRHEDGTKVASPEHKTFKGLYITCSYVKVFYDAATTINTTFILLLIKNRLLLIKVF